MIEKFFNIIKQGFYSLVSKDTDPYPQGQATLNGRPTKFIRASVYGVCSNPPKNSHIILLSSQGQESTKFGFINDFINRKRGLKEGEVALFNSKTGDYVFLKEDGVEIKTVGDLTANVLGKTTLTSIGDVDLTAPNFNFKGNVNIEGDVDIIGNQTNDGTIEATGNIATDSDLEADGAITSKGDVTADDEGTPITLLTHFHQGNLGFPVGAPIASGGGSAPSNLPTADSSGEITDGLGVKSKNHTHGGVESGLDNTGVAQ